MLSQYNNIISLQKNQAKKKNTEIFFITILLFKVNVKIFISHHDESLLKVGSGRENGAVKCANAKLFAKRRRWRKPAVLGGGDGTNNPRDCKASPHRLEGAAHK